MDWEAVAKQLGVQVDALLKEKAELETECEELQNEVMTQRVELSNYRKRAEEAEARAEALRAALRAYGRADLWVRYMCDGEATYSLFVGNEHGLEDGVLHNGWLIAQAALSTEQPAAESVKPEKGIAQG